MAKRRYLGDGVYLNEVTGELEGGNTISMSSPQTPSPPSGYRAMPSNYLGVSIIALLLFLIPGIVAIIYSSRVKTRYYAGDITGAYQESRKARNWAVAGITLFLIFMIYGMLTKDNNSGNEKAKVIKTALMPNYYCDVSTTLNVRERPNTNARVIGQKKAREECYVYSYSPSTGFAEIDFKGRRAYVSAEYLKPKDATNTNNVIPRSVYKEKNK